MTDSNALRATAAEKEDRADRSFARVDTDGFVTQAVAQKSAQKDRIEAALTDAGGAYFPGLFDADGNRIKAIIRNGEYGQYWMLLGADDKPTGTFVNRAGSIGPKPDDDPEIAEERGWVAKAPTARSTMGKMGLHEEWEFAPAKAEYVGGGFGFSGLSNVRPVPVRTDGGYPDGAIVLGN